MHTLYDAAAWIMKLCYNFCGNYGLAVVIFTFVSKLLLLPISVWVQKNSIKMVMIQPEINFMKVRFFGDNDRIAEEQSSIFKKAKYHPLASLVPTALQLLLLMAVIAAIKSGMGDASIDMSFIGIDLSCVPAETAGWFILSPVAAGVSALLMCIAQNASNVLQAEQSKLNKYGMLLLSVGLSVYLGWFVPVGVALYWVVSNLLAIAQLYILNYAIDPKKYVDYEQLEKSKSELAALQSIGRDLPADERRKRAKRERADYKRFFHIANKHLVFYSESSGFYKYYSGIIDYILKKTNIIIHYITSDPDDVVFQLARQEPKLQPYYIGEKKLITLMMKIDADVVAMTMPDIENFHIKRSYLRKDIDYVYIQHGMDSINMAMRKGSLDHYDTIFCTGINQKEEAEEMQKVYSLPQRRLVECGYPLLDEMRLEYAAHPPESAGQKTILIAPSWQADNIVDSCLEEILQRLSNIGHKIIVRPHPQHVRHRAAQIERLKKEFMDNPNVEIQIDFSSSTTVFSADLLITDWSSICYEYAYTTQKPVLFINTPMKVLNPDYKDLSTVPINITLRDEIGCSLDLDELDRLPNAVDTLLRNKDFYHEKIGRFAEQYVYNLQSSAEVGAKYIIGSIKEKIEERNKNEKAF